MTLFHNVRRKQFRYSHIVVITVFWVMFIFTIVMSVSFIKHCTYVPLRRDMLYISQNIYQIAASIPQLPEEFQEPLNFTLESMFLHVKLVKENLELFSLAILFFTINTFIMMFVAYRKNKIVLYILSFFMVIFGYFTFSYTHSIIDSLPAKVLGGVTLEHSKFISPDKQLFNK